MKINSPSHFLVFKALDLYFMTYSQHSPLTCRRDIVEAFERVYGLYKPRSEPYHSLSFWGVFAKKEKLSLNFDDMFSDLNDVRDKSLSKLAEFMLNPDIYYEKICNSFFTNLKIGCLSIIEETFLSKKSKRIQRMLTPIDHIETIKLIARIASDIRRGLSVEGKMNLLSISLPKVTRN